MQLPPPPRRIRPTSFGIVTYAFFILLITGMVLGPPISFLVQDRNEQTLLKHGGLARFDITGSRPTRGGQQIVNYVFERGEANDGAPMSVKGENVVSDEDFAAFADPKKRLVLYDPANPENAALVTSRSALANRHEIHRKFAIWFYPASAATILLFSAVGVRALRRRLRLLRVGVATVPKMARYAKSRVGWPGVAFQFTDADGKLRDGHQSFNIRVGGNDDFAPFLVGAVVFYDPDAPLRAEICLPRLSLFKIAQ